MRETSLKFLEVEAPGEKFMVPPHDPDDFGRPDAFDKLLEAMLRKYSKMEAQNAELDKQNTELKKQLDYFKAQRWIQASKPVQAILKECEGE